jgi:Mn2+/Fe2+ NRAMP family transporter
MMGKMLGGWLVRWMGMITAVIVILLIVACCIAFRHVDNVILLLGLLAVNCTMPITLYLSNVVLKGHEGLSFGLLAAALIPGYLLATL